MYYTVYKITNLLNGRFYIGKHQTRDLEDGYMGSGFLIQRAIEKHGLVHFKKEFLGVFAHKWQMNLAERIFVVIDKEITYNFSRGGQGGHISDGFKGMKHSEETKAKVAKTLLDKKLKRPHKEETKLKLSIARKGKILGPRSKKYKRWSAEAKQAQSKRMTGKKRKKYKSWSLEDRLAHSIRIKKAKSKFTSFRSSKVEQSVDNR